MEVVGLLKFFRDKKYLEDLLNGVVYCNTPEFYRLSGDEGVGDRNESCISSYRRKRDGEYTVLEIKGHPVSGILSATMHNGELNDAYLHCWVAVSKPQNKEESKSLLLDINRMREEFGCYYVFLTADKINLFYDKVVSENSVSGKHSLVRYSKESCDWGYFCKSDKYLYQREFRFLFDNCDIHDIEPRKMICKKGFSDILYCNEALRIVHKVTKKLMFYLDVEKCYSEYF